MCQFHLIVSCFIYVACIFVQITLPTGTVVKVMVSKHQLNLWIMASAYDYNRTTGKWAQSGWGGVGGGGGVVGFAGNSSDYSNSRSQL